jgi:hypothetical protein
MSKRGAMTGAALLGLVLLVPGHAAATDVDPYWLESIPAEYRGEWNLASGRCAPSTGRYRMRIEANEIQVGGDRFRTVNIGWSEEGGIGVVSDYVGPPRPWTRVDHLTVSRDGATLTDSHAGRTIVRKKCPR